MSTSEVIKNVEKEFSKILSEIGAPIEKLPEEVAAYAAERAQHLADIVEEPEYDQAVVAEAHNVLLFAGIKTVNLADMTDFKLFNSVAVGLRLLSAALIAV